MKSALSKPWQKIRLLFRWIYTAYRAAALTLGALLIFWLVISIYNTEFRLYTERVALPNGFQLAPTDFDRNITQILDRYGNQAVPPNVGEVMWCDDMIYGTREEIISSHPAIYPGDRLKGNISVHSQFIYDRKTKTLAADEEYIKYQTGRETRIRPISGGTIEFEAELAKRKLPAFDYHKAVRYLSVLNGVDVIPEGEMCSAACTDCGD